MQEINVFELQLDGNTPYYVHDIRYNYKMIVYPNLITENLFGLIVIHTSGHKPNEYGNKPNEEILSGKRCGRISQKHFFAHECKFYIPYKRVLQRNLERCAFSNILSRYVVGDNNFTMSVIDTYFPKLCV